VIYIDDFERGFVLGLNIGQQNSPYFRMIILSDNYVPTAINPNNLTVILPTLFEELSAVPSGYMDDGVSETYTPQSLTPNLNINIKSIVGTVTAVPK